MESQKKSVGTACLVWGILSFFLGWFPFIGWFFIIMTAGFGFSGLSTIKEQKIAGRGKTVTGLVLGGIGLAIAIAFLIIIFLPSPLAVAQSSDSDGTVRLNINGQAVSFKFTDETNGKPVKGIAASFGLDNVSNAQGILLIVDPEGRYKPQIVILEASPSNKITGNAVSSSETIDIPLTNAQASIIKRIPITSLKSAVHTVEGLGDALVLAVKILDQSGLDLGQYEQDFKSTGGLKVSRINRDEAGIETSVKSRLKKNIFMLADPGALQTKAGPFVAIVESVFIDALDYVADKNAIHTCGLPDEKILKVEAGSSEFYFCKHMYLSDYVGAPMVVRMEGVDEFGKKLTSGSLNLISKSAIGLAVTTELNNGIGGVQVPQGNYIAQINAEGSQPSSKDIEVKDQTVEDKLVLNSITPSQSIQPPPENPESNEQYAMNPIFFNLSEERIPLGIINEHYNFSFCGIRSWQNRNPIVSSPSDICNPEPNMDTPTGGNPPYHFQLETGKGFPPMGLVLHPNGYIDGIPTAVGNSSFSVCAVDQSGKQTCSETWIEVDDIWATFDSVSCEYDTETNNGFYLIVAKGRVKGGYGLMYEDAAGEDTVENPTNIGSEQTVTSETGVSWGVKAKVFTDCGTWKLFASNWCTPITPEQNEETSWQIVDTLWPEKTPVHFKAHVYVNVNAGDYDGKLTTTPIYRDVNCG